MGLERPKEENLSTLVEECLRALDAIDESALVDFAVTCLTEGMYQEKIIAKKHKTISNFFVKMQRVFDSVLEEDKKNELSKFGADALVNKLLPCFQATDQLTPSKYGTIYLLLDILSTKDLGSPQVASLTSFYTAYAHAYAIQPKAQSQASVSQPPGQENKNQSEETEAKAKAKHTAKAIREAADNIIIIIINKIVTLLNAYLDDMDKKASKTRIPDKLNAIPVMPACF